jgi:hypothetical protein
MTEGVDQRESSRGSVGKPPRIERKKEIEAMEVQDMEREN